MATMEETVKAAENLTHTTRDSYMTVMDHAVGIQERNVRFAQSVADDSIKELRKQAESNRAMTREIVERVENQRDALQRFAKESLDAYIDLLYAPLSYYKEGLEAAKKVTR